MKKQISGRERLGNLAPKFAELNDDILFGEVWSREEKLSLRDRSMITISALMGKGILDDSLKYHIKNAKNNGITRIEIVEMVTQLAFYCGWPNAWAVFNVVNEIYTENDSLDSEYNGIFELGEPNAAYAKYFIGNSYLKPLTKLSKDTIFIANVTFEPKCRNNWHMHKSTKGGGQILICTYGEGWYQEEGKDAQSLKAGDVITIPANIKHWHGAKKDSWFSHIAIEIPGEDTSNEWFDPVIEEYEKL